MAGVFGDKLQRVNWGTWGIDIQEFKPGRERSSDKLITPTLLFVGKLSRAKGIPWILEAFAKLSQQMPGIKLDLAGPIEEKGFLSKIKPNKNIRYLGVVKNRNLPHLFRKASLVLTPSVTTKEWEEQVGMVSLQSMACATPVISTYSGAIPEYIKNGRGCLLVKEKSSPGLEKAVKKLLRDPAFYQKQRQEALDWVRQNYEVKKNIIQIEKILLDL
jgi:glycosyltransferase involved in cell wall biosynthesis